MRSYTRLPHYRTAHVCYTRTRYGYGWLLPARYRLRFTVHTFTVWLLRLRLHIHARSAVRLVTVTVLYRYVGWLHAVTRLVCRLLHVYVTFVAVRLPAVLVPGSLRSTFVIAGSVVYHVQFYRAVLTPGWLPFCGYARFTFCHTPRLRLVTGSGSRLPHTTTTVGCLGYVAGSVAFTFGYVQFVLGSRLRSRLGYARLPVRYVYGSLHSLRAFTTRSPHITTHGSAVTCHTRTFTRFGWITVLLVTVVPVTPYRTVVTLPVTCLHVYLRTHIRFTHTVTHTPGSHVYAHRVPVPIRFTVPVTVGLPLHAVCG